MKNPSTQDKRQQIKVSTMVQLLLAFCNQQTTTLLYKKVTSHKTLHLPIAITITMSENKDNNDTFREDRLIY